MGTDLRKIIRYNYPTAGDLFCLVSVVWCGPKAMQRVMIWRVVLSHSVRVHSGSALYVTIVVLGNSSSWRFMCLKTLKTVERPDSQESSLSWHSLLFNMVRWNASTVTEKEYSSCLLTHSNWNHPPPLCPRAMQDSDLESSEMYPY